MIHLRHFNESANNSGIIKEIRDVLLHYDIIDSGFTVEVTQGGIKEGKDKFTIDIVKDEYSKLRSIEDLSRYISDISEIRDALGTALSVIGFHIESISIRSNGLQVHILQNMDKAIKASDLLKLIDSHPDKSEMISGNKYIWIHKIGSNSIHAIEQIRLSKTQLEMDFDENTHYVTPFTTFRSLHSRLLKRKVDTEQTLIFKDASFYNRSKMLPKNVSIINVWEYLTENDININSNKNGIIDLLRTKSKRVTAVAKEREMKNSWMIIYK